MKLTNKNSNVIVVDTSVLLYDKQAIHSFPNAEVILPLVVLDELDSFKEKPNILGESARYINRFLDSLRSKGRLDEGVYIEEFDQLIRVVCSDPQSYTGLDSRSDNKIIATALDIKTKSNVQVKIVTKDINLRVKCDALGLEAEDYLKDHVVGNLDDFGSIKNIQLSDKEVDQIYSEGDLELDCSAEDIRINSYCIVEGYSQGKSVLCQYDGKNLKKLDNYVNKNITDLKPRNKEQQFVIHSLFSDNFPLVCLTGLAGSGKTFLALMAGLDEVISGKYDRIVITRNIEPVGRDIGFLPGDINDKMNPWMNPIVDNIKTHFNDKTYFETMVNKGKIEIAPLSFIRGRTFSRSYIIVDEAQNATIHELKTVITRIGNNSKIILMGDTDQIDTPYIDKRSNGLSIVIDKFKNSNLMSHIHLVKGERSELATVAAKLL
jgi:PhoH-like ATPase